MRKIPNSELNRPNIEAYKKTEKLPMIIVLDNIRSCNNIGSVFRTSDAFLVEKILLCGITATPPNKDIRKTALDAEKSVEWQYFQTTEQAIKQLKTDGYTVYAVEQVAESISLENFQPKKEEKIAIVFGNEVKGVEQRVVNICNNAIEIPQYGTKHSLNISVSAGIVIWDIFKKMSV